MSTPKYTPLRDIPAGCWPTIVMAIAIMLLVISTACIWPTIKVDKPEQCPPGCAYMPLIGKCLCDGG